MLILMLDKQQQFDTKRSPVTRRRISVEGLCGVQVWLQITTKQEENEIVLPRALFN